MPINKILADDLSKEHKAKCLEWYAVESYEDKERITEELKAIKQKIRNNQVSWDLTDTHRIYDRYQNTMSVQF